MRSLERRFKRIEKENPYWSSYICFCETVKNQEFTKRRLYHWFNKLVKNDDYKPTNKKILLKALLNLNFNTEEGIKQIQIKAFKH